MAGLQEEPGHEIAYPEEDSRNEDYLLTHFVEIQINAQVKKFLTIY
jgi:hypothetical protein